MELENLGWVELHLGDIDWRFESVPGALLFPGPLPRVLADGLGDRRRKVWVSAPMPETRDGDGRRREPHRDGPELLEHLDGVPEVGDLVGAFRDDALRVAYGRAPTLRIHRGSNLCAPFKCWP